MVLFIHTTSLEAVYRFVGGENNAGAGDLGFNEPELFGLRPIRKKPLAAADRERVGPELHAIDQMMLEQCLDEITTSPDPQTRAVLLLQLLELSHHITRDADRVVPRRLEGCV